MTRHAQFIDFDIDYKRLATSANFAKTALGQRVIECILQNDSIVALRAVIEAAPSRPPYPAIERFLLAALGNAAIGDDVKVLAGRVIRQCVERLGGAWVRDGVVINVPSAQGEGSIYEFPGRPRGKLDAVARRSWAEGQIARLASASSHTA